MKSKDSVYLEKIVREKDPDYAIKPDIKWNFTKFLVDRKGNVIERFEPDMEMTAVEEAVKKLVE